MKDRINNSPESSDEWSTYVTEYVHKQEFGSPGFEAINDFYNLQSLYRALGNDRLIGTDSVNGKATLTPEERKDLLFRRISLLEHTVEQKQGNIEGYASAYFQVRDGFDSMLFEASKEARTNFPDDETKQTEYMQKIFGDTLTYVLNSIVEKQHINLP